MSSDDTQWISPSDPGDADGPSTVSPVSRRLFLSAAGLAGAAASFTVASSAHAGDGDTQGTQGAGADGILGDKHRHQQDPVAPVETPPVGGLHLQFGGDAAREVVVSWHTLQQVAHPRAYYGSPAGRVLGSADATTRSYVDAKSGQTVYVHHARLSGLAPATEYLYAAVHDGATPQLGTFTTAPTGRAKFTFTSFGDQGTPYVGKKFVVPAGVTLPNPPAYVNDDLGAPAAAHTVAGVERVAPLFHLFNGDLCYANLSEDRVRTWNNFWTNNTRSARNRPWMPSAGNHENELGNGPFGFRAYQTYFELPKTDGQDDDTRGLWYAFTVGAVRFISLNNDDVCYQDGGNFYVRGYSKGAQKAWLEKELKATRANKDIDWVVVCMHQVVVSTADKFNGADLGIRQEFAPLFDKYGVDLVVCGHEHHYERSHPIRGAEQNATLTPIPVATDTKSIDTAKGTVHMVLGGGGTSVPSNQLFFNPPACRVITAVGEPDPKTGKRPPVYVGEQAPWSAVRDPAESYGFAAFDVDPGKKGGETSMKVTYYEVVGVEGALRAFETFTLRRPRTDG